MSWEPVTGTVDTIAPVPAVACDWLMQSLRITVYERQQHEPAISLSLYVYVWMLRQHDKNVALLVISVIYHLQMYMNYHCNL